MADNKKYYYLKLKDNFFESDSMLVLESMQDGYLYSNILLKLYLRSLKNEGKLMFNDRIPYNVTILAQITRHSVGVVEKALSIFQQLDLIEILDNGAIYMLDIQGFIGKSSTEADRVRAYRNRINSEKSSDVQMLQQMNDKSTPEIEKEIEKDIDINIDKKNKKKTEYDFIIESYTDDSELRNTVYEFIKMRKTIKAPMTSNALKLMLSKLDDLSSGDKDKKFKILEQSIMNSWKGIFELRKESGQNQVSYSKEKSKLRFDNFKGRDYDYDDLEKKLLGWDDEIEEE